MKLRGKLSSESIFHVFNTLLMLFIVVVMLYPFWYVLVCSFSSLYHVQNSTFILLPDGIHLDAYAQLFRIC